MSDLQCPVRVFLVGAEREPEASSPLGRRLADERIAAVRTIASAAVLGQVLGEVADLYRGEAVLLLGPPDLPAYAVSSLHPGAVPDATGGEEPPVLALEGDADGWTVRPWPAEDDLGGD